MESSAFQTSFSDTLQSGNLVNIPKIQPSLSDSVIKQAFWKLNLDIINIDTIEVQRDVKPAFIQPPKEVVKPALSLQDSLKLNLIGKKGAYTNWNFNVEHDIEEFNETLFTQIDYSLLKTNEKSDTTFYYHENLSIDSLSIREENFKTHTELHETAEQAYREDIYSMKSDNFFLILILAAVIILGFVRIYGKDYISAIFHFIFKKTGERVIDVNNVFSFLFQHLIISLRDSNCF